MDLIESYKTVLSPSEGFFKDRGSKFYGFVMPVTSIEAIEEQLNAYRAKFHDARHVCYAWRLGPDGETFRANDDGEPSHSAGTPILNELRSFEVTDTLGIVIRYFGGTKLGVSGLIEAYKSATHLALSNAKIKTIRITRTLKIRYPYDKTTDINRLLHHNELEVTSSEFGADCRQTLEIPVADYEKVYGFFDNLGVIENLSQ